MLLSKYLLVVTTTLFCSSLFAEGQNISQSEINGIRLVDRDGTSGGYKGRVEILYNGQWGTVCDDAWQYNDAVVACRMLDFAGALCAVQSAGFGRGSYSSPIWMDNVRCSGDESALDLCDFPGWRRHDCSHSEDAGVVCSNDSTSTGNRPGIPYNITLIGSSTRTLTIGWITPTSPEGTSRRYTIRVRRTDVNYYYNRQYYFYRYSYDVAGTEISYTIQNLQKGANYSIQIRHDVRLTECNSNYVSSSYSDPITFQTNATSRQSNIPVRLVSSHPDINFMGRVEVFHNNEWGTVCDDLFATNEASVICAMLNFTAGALCYVGYGRLGQGQGRIWLDNVDCSADDEILEDCSFNAWGSHNCDHSDDVGVICRSQTGQANLLPPVENVTVSSVGPRSITIGWKSYSFPAGVSSKRFQVLYISSRGYRRTRTVYIYSQLQYNTLTLRSLSLGETYNISVRAYISFFGFGCYSSIYGVYSDSLRVTTVETAPTAPPGEFHVIALNASAIEVQWELPPYGLHGVIIRGYKIFILPANGGEEVSINITNNSTNVYIVGGLQAVTLYRISILAYTSVGDGPRTVFLTVATLDHNPLIIQFGYYGNNVDRHTVFTWQRGHVHIFCGTNNLTHAPADWFFANGTRIGIKNRKFRTGHFINGTAILQIAENRQIQYCDGGSYTCVVTTTDKVEKRNFTLIINNSPPAPERPFAITVQSRSITIGWSESSCDGGHTLNGFSIQYYSAASYDYYYYYYRYPYYYYYNYQYIRSINSTIRNYTISDLEPDTEYTFQVKAISTYAFESSYSLPIAITTLPPAPTPPRDVSARLVKPLTVEVRWREPAVPNGNISHFTVHAIPLTPSGEDSIREITITFPNTANAGNITLADYSITYHFRVSAAVLFEETYNEGELSLVSSTSTLFVPNPNPPVTTVPDTTVPDTSQNLSINPATIGEIAGIAIGVVIVILLAVLILAVLIKKRKPMIFKRMKSMGYGDSNKMIVNTEHMYDEAPFADTESKEGSIFDAGDSKEISADL